MDSQPYSATIRRKRCAISSSASSQEMRSQARVGTDAFVRPSGAQLRSSVGTGDPARPSRRSLRPYPSHRIQHPLRRVHAVQILGDFRAKKPAGNRVHGIALNLDGAPVFNGDQNATSVRAIVRAGGVDNALHSRIIVETGLAPSPTVKGHAASRVSRQIYVNR